MNQAWLQQRPHLAPLVLRLEAVLTLADELYEHGRASGDSVDYGAFEERVARACGRPAARESRETWPGTFRRWKEWLLEKSGDATCEASGMQNALDASGNRPVGDAVRYF